MSTASPPDSPSSRPAPPARESGVAAGHGAELPVEQDTDLSPRGLRIAMGLVLLGILLFLATGAYWASRKQIQAQRRIVCFGDSLTASGGYGGRYSDYLARALPDCEIINKGLGGDTLDGGANRFSFDVLNLNPKVVIIELGANDFHKNERPIEALRKDLESMVRQAVDRGIGVVIAGVFGDQLDSSGKRIDKVYKEGESSFGQQILNMEREVAAQYGVSHIENIQYDLNRPEHWENERHPSATGNKLVAQQLLPAVQRELEAVLLRENPPLKPAAPGSTAPASDAVEP